MIREQAIHKDVIASFLEGKEVQYFSKISCGIMYVVSHLVAYEGR